MNKFTFTTFLTAIALAGSTYATPAEAQKAEAPAKKPVKKVKLEAIESPMTLAELQENIFFREPMCRAASIGIATNFGAQGTGVIISKDGIILTAAHVVDKVGAEFTAYLANGETVRAIAVLINPLTDSAVGKIIDPMPAGGFPFRPIRTADDLVKGDWCTVIANGGGIQPNRPAPLRIGRLLTNTKTKAQNVLVTDCTVTSGDSGGPLFDTDGNVCGINSSVGAGSALDNKHISSKTFIQQWGDYLIKNKPLPTAEEVRKQVAAEQKASGELVTSIPKQVLPAIKQALKKQYPDLSEAGMNAILKSSSYSNGQLNVKGTPELAAELIKLGLDPVKYGITAKPSGKQTPKKGAKSKPKKTPKKAPKKTPKKALSMEEQFKQQFGDISPEAMEFLKQKALSNKERRVELGEEDLAKLKEMGVDMEAFQLRKTITSKFGKVSEEAMKFMRPKFVKNEKGSYELKVTPDDIMTLKAMGVDVIGKKGDSEKEMLEAIFEKQYGKNLSKKALKLLHGAAIYDKKTKKLRMNLDATTLKKLMAEGIKINTGNGAKLIPLEKNHGDSADSIAKYFPATPAPIHLMQGGKRVGLATAISAEGKLLCKSSSLKKDKDITVSIAGKVYTASLVARDEISDLALIHAALLKSDSVEVIEWSDTPRRGKLIISATEATPKLGVVSVDRRIVPEKTLGVGNGNKAILGVVSDATKKVDGSLIEKVQPGAPAEKGGIKKGDIITAVGGVKISSQQDLRKQVGKYKGGDVVKFTIKRGDETKELMIALISAEESDMFSSDATNSAAQDLSALAGELSGRRTTFPEAFSHDALIWNDDCGGPVYTIHGELLGINIARYSRITSYALTQKSVEEALERMEQAK